MLSVLIEAREGDEEKLARTLASLVGAVVEGGVREVIVVAPDRASGVGGVAEHAGCRTAEQWLGGVLAARGEWLLLLEPGARPIAGWTESALLHIAEQSRPARLTRDTAARRAFGAWLFGSRRPLRRGLLVRREQAVAGLRGSAGVDSLARRLRPVALVGRIAPAG